MPKKPIMAPDGGYLLDGDDFVITKDELGRPVISVVGGATGEVKKLWKNTMTTRTPTKRLTSMVASCNSTKSMQNMRITSYK